MHTCQPTVTRSALAFALLAVSIFAGCGPSDSAIHFTGAVTYGGKPVPAGMIQFSPDRSQGNNGHGCMAIIKDGRYSTHDGLGTVGGAYVVRVLGFDGIARTDSAEGTPIFKAVDQNFELPMESGEFDIDVPVNAKRK